MRRAPIRFQIAAFAAAILAWGAAGTAGAQAPAAAVTHSGIHVIKLTNNGHGGITAVYVAKAGTLDASDDLLGKQTANPGKTVTLKVQDPDGSCMFDLQFLMNDGSTVTRKGVNLCETEALPFGPQ